MITNYELVDRAKEVLSLKTLYVSGGQGQNLCEKNKRLFINNYKYNQSEARKKKINAATEDTWAFDCCGLIKSLIWGFNHDKSKDRGGAKYASNNLADISEQNMINQSHPSTDFSKIVVGAVVYIPGHIGLYIGDGLVIESSPAFKDCVQITSLVKKPGYNYRKWDKWGKLPCITYMEQKTLQFTNQGKKVEIKDNYLMNNKNYTGIRELLESLGFDVNWDPKTGNIDVVGKVVK